MYRDAEHPPPLALVEDTKGGFPNYLETLIRPSSEPLGRKTHTVRSLYRDYSAQVWQEGEPF